MESAQCGIEKLSQSVSHYTRPDEGPRFHCELAQKSCVGNAFTS